MKIIRCACFLVCLTLSLFGCAPQGKIADWRGGDARAELRWEREGVTVCASVDFDAKEVRRMEFSQPPAMAGAVLTVENGNAVLCREGLTLPCKGAQDWLAVASLLCATGELETLGETDHFGVKALCGQIVGADGETVCEVVCDGESGIPLRVRRGELEVTVLRWEAIT